MGFTRDIKEIKTKSECVKKNDESETVLVSRTPLLSISSLGLPDSMKKKICIHSSRNQICSTSESESMQSESMQYECMQSESMQSECMQSESMQS